MALLIIKVQQITGSTDINVNKEKHQWSEFELSPLEMNCELMSFPAEALGFTVPCLFSKLTSLFCALILCYCQWDRNDRHRKVISETWTCRQGRRRSGAAGMQHWRSKGPISPVRGWMEPRAPQLQGFQRRRSCLPCLWAALSSVVHLFPHWLPGPCSAQQREKKKIEKKNKKCNENEMVKGGQQDERGTPLWADSDLGSEASAAVVPKEQYNALASPLKHVSVFICIYRSISLGWACLLGTTTSAPVPTERWGELAHAVCHRCDRARGLASIPKAAAWLFKTLWKEINRKQFRFVIELYSWIKSYPLTVRVVFKQNTSGHDQPCSGTAKRRSLLSCDWLAATSKCCRWTDSTRNRLGKKIRTFRTRDTLLHERSEKITVSYIKLLN